MPGARPFLSIENANCDFYIGKNAGNKMLNKLKSATESVKIVAPYISSDMIDELNFLCAKGVNDIELITFVSYSTKNNQKILSSPQVLKRLICSNPDMTYKEHFKTIFFKTTYIHEKLYIIDKKFAFAGSFNFTNHGIYDNHETAFTFEDRDTVEKIVSYFEGLYTTKEFEKWKLEELGELVYSQYEEKRSHHCVNEPSPAYNVTPAQDENTTDETKGETT